MKRKRETKMKAKAKALILVAMFALPGASAPFLANGAGSSISYHGLNNSAEPGPLPDLIIKSATFYFTKAVVVVQNVGGADSGKTNLTLVLFSGTDPLSKVHDSFKRLVQALHPGQKFTVEFDIEKIGKLTFNKHARKLTIDDPNVVAESNENNNELFSTSDPLVDQGGDWPKPADSILSNLTFSQVKFIAPNSVHYCVKNTGYGPSTFYKVRTTIFAGAKKDSGLADMNQGPYEKNPFSIPGNILQPNAVACQDFTFATADGKSVMEGRGRLVEIILDNGAKDADGTNKSYFSPGIEGLWQKKN
jgi:hypothetical protein